jgi:predicted secreted protein
MTLTLRTWSGLTLVAALLAACATPEKPKAPPPPPPVAAVGQRMVLVSDANAGAAVALESTQELIVRLPTEGAAGLEWTLVDLKPGVLTLLSSKFERALRNTNVEEAAGATVWHFRPQATGSVALKFELRRPRSLQPPTQTVGYDVTVK